MESKLNQSIIDQFESLESRLNGSKKLPFHKLRQEALNSLKEAGLPGNKHEEYKFTRLTAFLEKNIDLNKVNRESSINDESIKNLGINDIEGSSLVFVNDVLVTEYSNILEEHKDILINPIARAVESDPGSFENYFSKQQSFQHDGFLAWNTALTENGVHIRVAQNKSSKVPVNLFFLSDAQHDQVVNNPRVLIEMGVNSEVTFVERFITIGDHLSFNNAVVEVIASEGVNGSYVKIQNDNENAVMMNTTQLYQPDSSTFSCYTFTFSGKMVRNNLNFVVDGKGSEANMYGLYLTRGGTHVDNHTSVDHKQPHSFSNELYKGILDDKSRGVFNGKIFVRQAAQKTNAFQANNNIIISSDATVNTKPQLEIWADDVKCSHGCTIGQLDEEQVFYLRSRGVDKDYAVSMLLHAFASDVINKIPLESIREQLEKLVIENLDR